MTDKANRLPMLRMYPDFAEAKFPERQKSLREYKDMGVNELLAERRRINRELIKRFKDLGS